MPTLNRAAYIARASITDPKDVKFPDVAHIGTKQELKDLLDAFTTVVERQLLQSIERWSVPTAESDMYAKIAFFQLVSSDILDRFVSLVEYMPIVGHDDFPQYADSAGSPVQKQMYKNLHACTTILRKLLLKFPVLVQNSAQTLGPIDATALIRTMREHLEFEPQNIKDISFELFSKYNNAVICNDESISFKEQYQVFL